ncbi:hypothetical protein HPP92_023147 [Vanilla planifolia]|uniref:Cytochrome b561 domain-containing protein n=1 Tax=Vanilla planifolia TaxID=51239 RepID=A0A835UEA9_VANPL|nr:hypothetical protein HPP92_023147 [Vanilla planifolia]
MPGTRALVAIGQAVGPPVVASYNVTTDTLMGCKLENSSVEFRAEGVRSNYSSVTGRMVLAATLRLPSVYNPSRLNQVWQVGPAARGMALVPHAQQLHNFDGVDTLNLATGQMFGYSNTALRDAHGVLSVIGWGIIMPAGILIVRYFRSFPFQRQEYFLLHASCQLSAYVVGTTAWGIGLALLGSTRYYKTIMGHRVIGVLVFCLATLQMMALWLKPKKRDKYRRYWSIYHHFVGYSLVALTVVNIFKGFKILKPPPKWRWVYVAILASIGCAVLVLEIITWYKFYVLQKKKAEEHKDVKSAKAVQVTSNIQVADRLDEDGLNSSLSSSSSLALLCLCFCLFFPKIVFFFFI